MKFWYQKPHPDLFERVKTVLIMEGFSESTPAKVPLFTSGMPAFICRTERHQNGETVAELSLYGKSAPSDCFAVDASTTLIAYFFKPFSISSMFDIAMVKLVKGAVPLEHWSARKSKALYKQLAKGLSTNGKIDVIESLLLQQLCDNKKTCDFIAFATDQIMQNSNPDSLSSIVKRLDVTERTFQRTFKKYVGISANQYRRICQFQLSFSQLRAKEFSALTDVAYDNGFADQSHFIRSFKEFTETTPKDYLKSGLKKDE
jgi:AraC-like DNA-binding protein